MVTHFSVTTGDVACGRNNHDVTGTRDKRRVSCRSCRSTELFKTHPDVQIDSVTPMAQGSYNWRRAWTAAALVLRPQDRLPRGFKKLVNSSSR
jgi:hypothetical protein